MRCYIALHTFIITVLYDLLYDYVTRVSNWYLDTPKQILGYTTEMKADSTESDY